MDIFESIISQYNTAIGTWETIAIQLASRLFYVLAGIQLTWAGILWMLNHNDPLYHLTEFIKKIMVIAFFWTVIDQAATWIPAIVNSFRGFGSEMSGMSSFSPGDVGSKGMAIASTLINAAQQGGFLEKFAGAVLGAIVALIIFLAFILVAIEMVLVLIGSKIILIGGLVMLGFGATQWTQDFTQKYFVTCIHVGLKLMFLTLIVGLADNMTDTWADLVKQSIAQNKLFETYFSIMAAALLYAVLAIRIPDMGASMLTGSFGMGFNTASMAGATVVTTGLFISNLRKSSSSSTSQNNPNQGSMSGYINSSGGNTKK